MSLYVIVPDAPEVREHWDAIRYFASAEDLPALVERYGGERAFAEANLAALSDTRSGRFHLLEGGQLIAVAEYGIVRTVEAAA